MSVRAKFRCMSVTHTWDGVVIYKMMPVNDKGDEENKQFWKWTPSGDLELVYFKAQDPVYEVSGYFYLDFTPDGVWEVSSIEQHVRSNFNVCLHPDWGAQEGLKSGTLRMGISNPDAYEQFKLGDKWSLQITAAG